MIKGNIINFDIFTNYDFWWSNFVAYKPNEYWKLIADYINPFPKHEKVHKVIKEVNFMREQAMDIAKREAHLKRKR